MAGNWTQSSGDEAEAAKSDADEAAKSDATKKVHFEGKLNFLLNLLRSLGHILLACLVSHYLWQKVLFMKSQEDSQRVKILF